SRSCRLTAAVACRARGGAGAGAVDRVEADDGGGGHGGLEAGGLEAGGLEAGRPLPGRAQGRPGLGHTPATDRAGGVVEPPRSGRALDEGDLAGHVSEYAEGV